MWLFATMAARVGILNQESLMSVVAKLYGRPIAVIVGLLAFVVTTAFQLGNYLACATALTTLSGIAEPVWIGVVGLAGLVVLLVRQLYRFAERFMSILVFGMVAAFFVNLLFARPDVAGVITGFVPRPWTADSNPLILAMIATTFSVIAAFYQGTLARQKGWAANDLALSRREAAVGIGLLASISLVIMITAATVLRGVNVTSAAVLSEQLEPILGPLAVWMFSFGFLSAAFSSVVINPMVGGGILSDALGLGERVDSKWPRLLTAAGMIAGIVLAYFTLQAGSALEGIVLAQGATVLAVPLCAVVLVMLANDKRAVGEHRNGWLSNAIAGLAIAVLFTMSVLRLRG
jgi:manganese transport protein